MTSWNQLKTRECTLSITETQHAYSGSKNSPASVCSRNIPILEQRPECRFSILSCLFSVHLVSLQNGVGYPGAKKKNDEAHRSYPV